MLKETIQKIVLSQKNDLKTKKSIQRSILSKIKLNSSHIKIISGIRRAGKSTLMTQLIKKTTNYHHLNFEDPRLINFKFSDFEKLNEIFQEISPKTNTYFFDEIQNIPDWERPIRYMHDQGKKIILTGSNASLLSKELGTKLTGRHLRFELFPFSFEEYLTYFNKKRSLSSFKRYFKDGGFPEYLKSYESELLMELFNDTITRDIIVRHKIREQNEIKSLAIYLLSNISCEFSFNKLKKLLNLGSVNTVISYISYLEDSYLIFTIPKFDYSYKKQLVNPKKVYSIDHGLSRNVSTSFSKNDGRILENIVFLSLRRKHKDIYYFKDKGECDFVIKEGTKITKAIQVCLNINEDNKDREINGLLEAIKTFKLKEGYIITLDQEDTLTFQNKKINLIPAHKFL